MQVEVSRRRFLQGSIAMSVVGVTAVSATKLFASIEEKMQSNIPNSITTKTTLDDNAVEVATLCEMCVNKCAAIARVEKGVVTKLEPNPMFPKSKNMLCPRGNAGIQALYDPDRLKSPMVRVGEKGEGKFKKVTWEEAYEAILHGTDKFTGMAKILDEEKDNRSSFLFCAGEGMAEHTFKQFYYAFGSSNWLNHASLCLQTVLSGYSETIGGYPDADLDNAEYIIMAGANRAEAIVTPDTQDLFKRTKGRGAKLICIDPRFTNTASKSDKWLAINPGTDLAFVLALTYVVINEKLYDEKYVKDNFSGFESYKKSILENRYTPQWAEKITAIRAKDIYTIAREFMAHAPKAVYYPGRRSTFAGNDFQLRRAMAIFQALGGGIDTKGGLVFGKKLKLAKHEGLRPTYNQSKIRAINSEKSKNVKYKYDDYAMISGGGSWIGWRNRFLEKKIPYKVRGMFIYKHNPMINMPNSQKTAQMLKEMELVVAIDTMPSDTVMYADVVLPESTYLERTDPVKSFGGIEPSIAQRNRVVEPLFDTKPVIEILYGLTQKISKPIFDITRKYDEDVREELEDADQSDIDELYEEYDLTQPFKESQEKINEKLVRESYGEEAVKALKEYGVFYPKMDSFFRPITINEHQYYPEKERFYSVNGGKPKTSSGKVECYIPKLAKSGLDPMPVWRDEYNFSVPKGKFRLLTGRHAQFTQAGTANNVMLRDLMKENYLWINQRVANKQGIKFGDRVEVSSRTGKTILKAYPTEKISPVTLFFVHGFGEESDALTWAYRSGGNDNMVIEDIVEPVYGSASMHETNVEIRKV
jgi:thiosulfate reductase/polysulfide reductase chain A